MTKKIIWSPLSISDIDNILDHLVNNWNKQIANNFLQILESILSQISKNSKQYPIVNKKKGIRKCVISKQNSIYYREKDGNIELLRIFDNRQNPKKLSI